MPLTPTGLDRFRYEKGDPQGALAHRPFLSNLAVRRDCRRKGIAKRLCGVAERTARGWGYSEVLPLPLTLPLPLPLTLTRILTRCF